MSNESRVSMSDTKVQEEPTEKPAEDAAVSSPDNTVLAGMRGATTTQFNDDITIYIDQRLSQYDKGPIKAYAGSGKGKAPARVFVMVCEPDLVPRSSKTANYVSVINPDVTRLVATGPFYWPPEKRERYGFVYEDNLGHPIMKDSRHGGLAMKPEDVLGAVVRPIVSALMDFRDKDIVHGNINPGNMFDGGKKKLDRAMLGECLSAPASSMQPVLYETIERGMATPIARGIGGIQDDMYALGVSLAVMLRSHDPMEGMSDDKIIQQKMEHGSYNALIGKDRFTGSILELLRGLLYDDAVQRWNIDDVNAWLDGRRLSPKQSAKRLQATRPIMFNGQKYIYPEALARDLQKNPSDVVQMVEGGELDQWLQRAIDDAILTTRVEKAITLASDAGRSGAFSERLTTRLGIALHPDAPIRYKDLSVMPDGVGKALTQAYIKKANIQLYEDLVNQHFVVQWVDMLLNATVDSSSIISRFDSCRNFLRQAQVGYGIERCIYYLNPECPCLSDKLKDYYVRSPEDMMSAFEDMSSKATKPLMFFDRHIVAFLSVKDRKNIDPYLPEINNEQAHKKILGEIRTLATIQKRSRLGKFPGICNWIAESLGSVYERYHDRELRETLKSRIEKMKDGGDITKIAGLLDDNKTNENDRREYRRAMQEYYHLERESHILASKLEKDKTFGRETGRQASAFVSGVIAAIIIIITAFLTLTGKNTLGF